MTKENELRKGVGTLTAKILVDSLDKALPGIAGRLQESKAIANLREGDLEAANLVAKSVKKEVVQSVKQVGGNPFYADLKDAAKSVVGAPMAIIFSPGSVYTGVITKAAAYSGEAGGPEGFDLHQQEPGTVGIWGKKGGRGVNVSCIAAHPDGEEGYIAIWGVQSTERKYGMNDVTRNFSFDQLTGQNVTDPRSQIKIMVRDPEIDEVTMDTRVYSASKSGKGSDIVAAYELKAKK
tara:strand:+ start:1622 stop:2329 length:708 start_codon:yes stop_codon:yes gene_type:complete